MKKNIIISFVLLSTVLSSCEKTFNTITNIEIPHTSHLVLGYEYNNLMSSNMINILSLSASKGVTTAGNIDVISNANIQLFEDNVLQETLPYNPLSGYETQFVHYEAGKKYKIKAIALGYNEIEAEDIMPNKPNISSVEFIQNAKNMTIDGTEKVWFDELKFTIQDDANTNDYYTIDVTRNLSQFFFQGQSYGQQKITYDSDVDIEEEGFDIGSPTTNGAHWGKIYLKDIGFNGGKKTISIFMMNGSVGDNPSTFEYPWYFKLENLSEAGYKYEKTHFLYNLNEGNPFSEPVQVYNNVKNGNGIFRLTNVLIDSLQ